MAKTIKKETVLAVIGDAGKRGVVRSPKDMCRRYKWDVPTRVIETVIATLVKDGFAKLVTRTDGSGQRRTFVVAV